MGACGGTTRLGRDRHRGERAILLVMDLPFFLSSCFTGGGSRSSRKQSGPFGTVWLARDPWQCFHADRPQCHCMAWGGDWSSTSYTGLCHPFFFHKGDGRDRIGME